MDHDSEMFVFPVDVESRHAVTISDPSLSCQVHRQCRSGYSTGRRGAKTVNSFCFRDASDSWTINPCRSSGRLSRVFFGLPLEDLYISKRFAFNCLHCSITLCCTFSVLDPPMTWDAEACSKVNLEVVVAPRVHWRGGETYGYSTAVLYLRYISSLDEDSKTMQTLQRKLVHCNHSRSIIQFRCFCEALNRCRRR